METKSVLDYKEKATPERGKRLHQAMNAAFNALYLEVDSSVADDLMLRVNEYLSFHLQLQHERDEELARIPPVVSREYPHVIECNSNRSEPPGKLGTNCCCKVVNRNQWESLNNEAAAYRRKFPKDDFCAGCAGSCTCRG
jgi:hypothetical protein